MCETNKTQHGISRKVGKQQITKGSSIITNASTRSGDLPRPLGELLSHWHGGRSAQGSCGHMEYWTPGTRYTCAILLEDSTRIQFVRTNYTGRTGKPMPRQHKD